MNDRFEAMDPKMYRLVLDAFDGDPVKTLKWLVTRNPSLGHFSPTEMLLIKRGNRLYKFINNSLKGDLP